jgi:hypothetical protein
MRPYVSVTVSVLCLLCLCLSGIGEVIALSFPLDRHLGSSGSKLAYESTHCLASHPLTPPRTKPSHGTNMMTHTAESYDSHHVPNVNDSLSNIRTIRTSCGIDRSAGFHNIIGNTAASSGSYFFTPLNEIHTKDSPSYKNCQNRLFLVGVTFNPLTNENAIVTDQYQDTMMEHLLSIGTFLRGDDLFVDVGKTKRHA